MNMDVHLLKISLKIKWLLMWAFFIISTGSMAPNTVTGADLSLITPLSLYKQMDTYVVIDARPKSNYQKGHIQGALSLSWEDYTTTDDMNVPYRILAPENLAERLGKLGISETTAIVVYGDVSSTWGGEGWVCWMLLWLGHIGDVRLLDGGVEGWNDAKYPLYQKQSKKKAPVVYTVDIKPNFSISTGELRAHLNSYQVIDTRSFFERIRGKIPGSIHINWEKFFNHETNKPIDGAELKKILKKNNIALEKPVVYYCTGGIRSAFAWTVHQLSGIEPAINYEGGMAAWTRISP